MHEFDDAWSRGRFSLVADNELAEARFGAKYVREMLDKHGFKSSKSMGQNFLIDGNIPKKIVRLAGIDESCGILEVGPGIGSLTIELSRVAGRVTAVELDRRLLPLLSETLEGLHNVEVVQGDILKLDINKLICEKMPGYEHHICANLPYNITTPAISAFIKADAFVSMTIMVQKEVARRICAGPGSSDYSAFSVFVQYYAQPQVLFDVPPECFLPRPRVWSSVLMVKLRLERFLEPEHEKAFFKVVRAAFNLRRKTLVNALHSMFGDLMVKDDIAKIVYQCGFDVQVRGEMLSIEDFALLSRFFK